jgi:hypothetical protein
MCWQQIHVPSTILWNAPVARIAVILTLLLVMSCITLLLERVIGLKSTRDYFVNILNVRMFTWGLCSVRR